MLFLGVTSVTCFFSPLFNGCWRLSIQYMTGHLYVAGIQFASAEEIIVYSTCTSGVAKIHATPFPK